MLVAAQCMYMQATTHVGEELATKRPCCHPGFERKQMATKMSALGIKICCVLFVVLPRAAPAAHSSVRLSPNADSTTRLAAAEVSRYLKDAQIGSTPPIVVLATAVEAPQLVQNFVAPSFKGGYSIASRGQGEVQIIGSDSQHVLYGCYSYLERLGFTFTSAGPTMPAPGQENILPHKFEIKEAKRRECTNHAHKT